jgi:hypothetical protein
MLYTKEQIENFIIENYQEVDLYLGVQEEIISYCPKCKADMGMQIIQSKFISRKSEYADGISTPIEDLPFFVLLRCPRCGLYRIWVI